MNITQKDIKTLWRSPFIWLMLGLLSFLAAWMLWQMIDKYVALQANFAALPNPPNITQSLWAPFLLLFAKLMMLVVALTSSYAIAQERSQQTLWYLMINRQSFAAVVWQKLKAQWVIFCYLLVMLSVVALLLAQGGELNWLQVTISMLGLMLFVNWLICLGMMISAYCQTAVVAALLNIIVYLLFWLLGGESVEPGYGINWLQLVSPIHHLKWFFHGEISVSSLLYFLFGSGCFLMITTQLLRPEKP